MLPSSMLARGTHLPAALVVAAALALPLGERSFGHEELSVGLAAPIRFVPNRGQWPDEVQFGVRAPSRTLLLRDGWAMGLERWEGTEPGARERRGAVVRMTFQGALPAALQGEDLLPGRHHFLLGSDADRWVRDVPGFGRVRYHGLYPGIDVEVRGAPQRGPGSLLEYDLLLEPGADLGRVEVQCEGIERLDLDREGSLVMYLVVEDREVTLTQSPPICWVQHADGSRQRLHSGYVLLGPRRFGFSVEGWDGSEPLVLDPGLVWSTYLGGGSSDSANRVHWRTGDGVLTAGWTGSMNFPTTPGAYRQTGMRDAFITKLSEDGETLLFSTYLGGSGGEEIRALGVGPGGTVVVAGWTGSPDFPTTGDAIQPTFGGASLLLGIGDGFMATLSADGSSLLHSTFLGGMRDEVVEALHVDDRGTVVVVGHTGSPDFPITPGSFQTHLASRDVVADGFVSRIGADGSLQFSTYIGGMDWDQLDAVHVDARGVTTAVGYTNSPDFPTTAGASQFQLQGFTDAVVVQLDALGRELLWSTHLGGTDADQASAVFVALDGSVLVGGFTTSVDFPVTPGVLQPILAGSEDSFLARLSPDGAAVLWGTYLGGEGADRIADLEVDHVGDISVVGGTTSLRFPTSTDASQAEFGGGYSDGFLARLDGAARQLAYATYLGGSAEDRLTSLSVSEDGFAVVSGWSWSQDLPVTAGAAQERIGGTQDALLAKLDLVPRSGWAEVATGSAGPSSAPFEAGERFGVLTVQLVSVSPEVVVLEALRVLVAGVGDNRIDLVHLRLYHDRNADGRVGLGDQLVAGPMAFPEDNQPIELAVSGLVIPPGGTVQLLIELEASRICADGAEFTAAVTGFDAWCVRTTRTRKLRMRGEARLQGRVHVCLARIGFSGDANGDGRLDAGDLRALARQLGEIAGAVDPDGDGLITGIDLELLADRVLTRPVLVRVPGDVAAPGPLTLQGYGLAAGVSVATLGGLGLELLTATDRELVFAVDAGTPLGPQELILAVGGAEMPSRVVTVR